MSQYWRLYTCIHNRLLLSIAMTQFWNLHSNIYQHMQVNLKVPEKPIYVIFSLLTKNILCLNCWWDICMEWQYRLLVLTKCQFSINLYYMTHPYPLALPYSNQRKKRMPASYYKCYTYNYKPTFIRDHFISRFTSN